MKCVCTTMSVLKKSKNFNSFFQTLEYAFLIKSVPEELKAKIMISLLTEKLNNILSYIGDKDLKSYKKVKNLALKKH